VNKIKRSLLLIPIGLSFPFLCIGKISALFSNERESDSTFIQSYDSELILRTYLSQKYTSISIGGSDSLMSFKYRPNTTLNFGVGATWKSFTLNLAYGFPGLNEGSSKKGKTKYLDLQSHIYSKRWVADIFGQFYKGYYIDAKENFPTFPEYYQKPDLKVRLVGFSWNYIFNHNRFSYRATLIQNEWQKKSAGTLLLGFDFYYGVLNSDKTILPLEIINYFPQENTKRLRFVNFGPGIGYAYTFVYRENWFATASLTASLTSDFTKENHLTFSQNNHSISSNLLYRGGIGYNSRNWTASISIVNSTVLAEGASTKSPYIFRTGNYRLTYARRFVLKKSRF